MIARMKQWRKFIAVGTLAVVLGLGGAAHAAAPSEEEAATHDARTEGFPNKVQIEGSTAGTWIIFILVTIVSMTALFKDAKRTHLD